MIPGHVLVVGAGGIGCPALWGLTMEAGVERVTVVDPDVVERSNLPRQFLFAEEDLGRPKAHAAVARFHAGDGGTTIQPVHARLDDGNFAALTEGVDVVIDATDGAQTKDWLNHAAVSSQLPLVHAAGLRSEARMLVVLPGGRPCLSCLFGRLVDDMGSCADLGVWNGVVGVVGLLAARAAAKILQGDVPVPRYDVFDFAAGRTLSLEASADPDCPVCFAPAARLEAFPEPVACDVSTPSGLTADVAVAEVIDLRDVRCPLNLLRARRALARAAVGEVLEFQLGEEGAATVPDGVRQLGHQVVHDAPLGSGRLLRVRAVTVETSDDAFTATQIDQFARQLVLPDLGTEGQRRLARAQVVVGRTASNDPAAYLARRYLCCAGIPIRSITDRRSKYPSITVDGKTWRAHRTDGGGVHVALGGGDAVTPTAALGVLLADRVQRFIVNPSDTSPSLTLS